MDGSSIDARPKPPLKLAANSKSLESPRRFPPMRFRAPAPLDPGAALAAALLLALPGSRARRGCDPACRRRRKLPRRRGSQLRPPPEAAPPAAGNAASLPRRAISASPAKARSRRCSTPAPPISRRRPTTSSAWSPPTASAPWACPPPAITTAPLAEMNAAIEVDPAQANSYFMRAAAYETKKDYDKADRRSRQGDQPRRHARAISSCSAASSIATRATSIGRSPR